MTDKPKPGSAFLKDVAEFFASGKIGVPHHDIVYILPNKRAGMFLKRHIHSTMSGVGRMPQMMTMRMFLGRLAGVTEAPARTSLFMLYDAYRTVMLRRNPKQGRWPFDSFIFWGDIILNDFEEIDKSAVSAIEIFKNLRDVKEIQSDYLNEDQKEAVRRIWGENRLTGDADRFWLHTTKSKDTLARKFIFLWEILADVYFEYKRILADHGLASIGDIYRRALETVNDIEPRDNPEHAHYVFIGFNDATTVETLIFERLRRLGLASFVWDTAPLEIFGTDMGRPLQRLNKLVEAFPPPTGFETHPLSSEDITVDVYAVPSAVAQTKEAQRKLQQWLDNGDIEGDNAINTAVVLPDQSLLVPMLLSIPKDVEALNVTMGLNYRSTSFATLLQAIISMQLRARNVRGEICFYFEDVLSVLRHPHIHIIDPEATDAMIAAIKKDKSYNIAVSWLNENASRLAPVFTVIRQTDNPSQVASYLVSMLDCLRKGLIDITDKKNERQTFEIAFIDYLQAEISAVKSLAEEYKIEMGERTCLQLFERMLNYSGVPTNGTPLVGLQIMGVLETRTLDFDNVVILSMNENKFPRRQYAKTMIPYNLRAGYGMPDPENLESTYAYCFYRLIARSHHIALFHDSRSGQTSFEEVSRYVTRLLYLAPTIKITQHAINISSRIERPKGICVKKTPTVMKALDRFCTPGGTYLSASALKTYRKCQLMFFFKYIGGLREDDDFVKWMNAADHGNLMHRTIQRVYERLDTPHITAEVLEKLIDRSDDTVKRVAELVIAEQRYKTYGELPIEGRLAVMAVRTQVCNDLLAEKNTYCNNGCYFDFLEAEKQVKAQWTIDDDLVINWNMSIDMVTRTDKGRLRFIDYKTGKDDESVSLDIDSISKQQALKNEAAFQILTYCQAYKDIVNSTALIEPRLHLMRKMVMDSQNGMPVIESLKDKRKSVIDVYDDIEKEFKPALYGLIKEIFDPNIPFTQTTDEKACRFCPFVDACCRIRKDDKK